MYIHSFLILPNNVHLMNNRLSNKIPNTRQEKPGFELLVRIALETSEPL